MRLTPLALLVLSVSGGALANDAELRRCRGLPDATARLACYDAIAIPAARAGDAPKAAASAGTPAAAERFGLENRAAPVDQIDSIQSRIPGPFEGWGPNTTIRLANGQVWQIADGSARRVFLDNPKVTIRRGLLGSFFLDFENDNRSPRVRRLQ